MSEITKSKATTETNQWKPSASELFLHRFSRTAANLFDILIGPDHEWWSVVACDMPDPTLPDNAKAIRQASRQLIELAADMARTWQMPLQELYAERLAELEARDDQTLTAAGNQLGAVFLRKATNWSEIKAAQSLHDQHFHQQVIDWPLGKQLRHHALHVGKLVGHLAEAIDTNDYAKFKQIYLPDVLAFGVILASLIDYDLAESGLTFDLLVDN